MSLTVAHANSLRGAEVLSRSLAETDPEVHAAIGARPPASSGTLEMIASENLAPAAVLAAQGSVLTNKYAEGYPGRRYYGGCEHVDVDRAARDRPDQGPLRRPSTPNVQPHSGAQANAAVMAALLEPGDTILGLGPRPRWPPHPRDAPELLGPALRHRRLPRPRGRPPRRHGRGRPARP